VDHSSPELALPPAKRQQINGDDDRRIPDDQQADGDQLAGSSPPTTTADQTKWTQAELLDPSALADELSTSVELRDDCSLNEEERRRLQEIIRFRCPL